MQAVKSASVIVAVAILGLAACGAKSSPDDRRAADCFGYTMPAGWVLGPSKTGADLVLSGPIEYPVGSVSMHDVFTVRFLPGDVSLEDIKQQVLAATPAVVNGMVDEASRSHPEIPTLGVAKSATPTSTPITIGGHAGFRIDVRNTLTIGGAPIDRVNITLFIKFGTDIVDVAAGYLASREVEDKSLSDAFIASINFARCTST